jgi:hypothetical protein
MELHVLGCVRDISAHDLSHSALRDCLFRLLASNCGVVRALQGIFGHYVAVLCAKRPFDTLVPLHDVTVLQQCAHTAVRILLCLLWCSAAGPFVCVAVVLCLLHSCAAVGIMCTIGGLLVHCARVYVFQAQPS